MFAAPALLISLLLSGLVDPSADTKGFTPLHYACLAASLETVKALAEAGADPTLKDRYDRPFACAFAPVCGRLSILSITFLVINHL